MHDDEGDDMSKLLQAGMMGCAAILLAAMLTTPAAARIQCRGNFQMTKYGPIATPYCEEEQIAFVARSYGQRVTAAEVHNNPLTKVYLCQTIGYDSRSEGVLRGLRTGFLRPGSLTAARTLRGRLWILIHRYLPPLSPPPKCHAGNS